MFILTLRDEIFLSFKALKEMKMERLAVGGSYRFKISVQGKKKNHEIKIKHILETVCVKYDTQMVNPKITPQFIHIYERNNSVDSSRIIKQ